MTFRIEPIEVEEEVLSGWFCKRQARCHTLKVFGKIGDMSYLSYFC